MSYSSGLLNKRITILRMRPAQDGVYGRGSGGIKYEAAATIWADVTWAKGKKAMSEGAMDAYDHVMIRCRWNDIINRDCRIIYDGITYGIDSLHPSRQRNEIQITATELVGE